MGFFIKRQSPDMPPLVEALKTGEPIVFDEEEQQAIDKEIQRQFETLFKDKVFPKEVTETLSQGFAADALRKVVQWRIHRNDLKGVLEREKAQIGVYITLEEPTKSMIEEAASASFYEPEHFPGNYYPKIQILTIQELLDGKKVDYPQHAPVATFKKAQRVRKASNDEQNQLL